MKIYLKLIEYINIFRMQQKRKYKVVALGDTVSGKSSLLLNFKNKNDSPEMNFDYIIKQHSLQTGEVVTFYVVIPLNKIWDTSGLQRYRTITRTYYRGSDIALLVFDITSAESFDNIKRIAKELEVQQLKGLSMIVIGNKVDLIENEEIPLETAKHFAQSINAVFHYTSAKQNKGINELLAIMAQKVISKRSVQSKQVTVPKIQNKNKQANENVHKKSIKIIVVGNKQSRKIQLLQSFAKDPEAGAAFITRSHRFGKDKVVKFSIWDTAGQQRYRSLSKIYYRVKIQKNSDTDVALLAYDSGNAGSFQYLKSVVQQLRSEGPQTMFLIAVCTNNDFAEEQVSHQTVKNWIQSLNGILHYACEKKGKEELLTIMAEKFANDKRVCESITLQRNKRNIKAKKSSCL